MNRMLYVYKSMRNKLKHSWRSTVIFILLIMMMAALFFSRAGLSVCMVAFVAVSFAHTDFKKHIRCFFSSPLLWGMSLLFLLPLLSGLWSGDKKEWATIIQIKIPLLFMPLAFAGPFQFSKKQGEWLRYIFIGLVTTGTLWSMFYYLPDAAAINESYLRAKSIVTPLENDHVRFSWLVSVSILLAGWLCVDKRTGNKWLSVLAGIIATWLVVFLHLLVVRTGLFSFYIMVAGTAIWLLSRKIKTQYGIALIILLLSLPLVAYKVMPTFQNRVKYFLYDKGYFEKANYLPGSTDAVRVISLKAGWNVIKQEPVTGAGFGDVLTKTKKWYQGNYPGMIDRDKIYPSSEWLMYGAGCGWPGFILFSFCMLIPFCIKTKNKLLWWLLNATAAFSFLFDIGLEVQFGVFIYSFIILWWWKWLNAEKM
jgi:O-antigen ligase